LCCVDTNVVRPRWRRGPPSCLRSVLAKSPLAASCTRRTAPPASPTTRALLYYMHVKEGTSIGRPMRLQVHKIKIQKYTRKNVYLSKAGFACAVFWFTSSSVCPPEVTTSWVDSASASTLYKSLRVYPQQLQYSTANRAAKRGSTNVNSPAVHGSLPPT